MPIPGGTAGAHTDSMHQGSAKRDQTLGVAGLDILGAIIAPGDALQLTRNASDYIYFIDRTDLQTFFRCLKLGSNDFLMEMHVNNAYETIQHAALKDIVNGIASLDAGGALLAPGSEVKLTRDGSNNIEVIERTSGDIVYRWTRIGANDYECRINCGGVACKILNDSLINAANGIAGLDASGELAAAQLHMFDTLSEVTGSRAMATVYQNTSDILMMVSVSLKSNAACNFSVYVENANPPTVRQLISDDLFGNTTTSLIFFVPAGQYYKVNHSAGASTIYEWFEVTA